MSRLTIEIAPEQHRMIKTLATFSGLSIKEFILQKTLSKTSPDATSQLLAGKKNAKRLREAVVAPKSQHLKFESMDDLRNALGI
jgi:uncharacterized protein (DUF1778 family)